MVDLVALPVWVGTLIGRYQLDPQQASGHATLFLLGAVLASVLLAPVPPPAGQGGDCAGLAVNPLLVKNLPKLD